MSKRTMTTLLFFTIAAIAAFAQEAPKVQLPETRLFGVILVQGSNDASKKDAQIPPTAMKVLEEVRQFLPYKYFTLLDSSFIRSDHEASFRLNGPGKKSYTASMRFYQHPDKPDVLMVSDFDIFEIITQREGEKLVRHKKDHIDTSFSIKVGETIVVGTSRVDEESDAVIVLFSAG